MASINDVYNQLVTVTNKLTEIDANVNAGTTTTSHVNNSVVKLDADLNSGFAATVAALNAVTTTLDTIALIEFESAKLLYHLTQQSDTMICALEHISQNTCGILTQTSIQTELQTAMRDDLSVIRAIAGSAYPAAALELDRLALLRAEIHKCCPPKEPPPACTYAPCPAPPPAQPPTLPKRGDPQQPQ